MANLFVEQWDGPTDPPGHSPLQEPAGADKWIDPLSDGQEIAMSLLVVFSSTLSIIGSSLIIYKIVKNMSKATPYDRLLLGLSCSDIVASLSWLVTPFLMPKGTSVWAAGTEGTCNFVGVMTQFGLIAIGYNCVLSFYYLFTIRFGVKRRDFAARYEPYMHILLLLYFTVTSIAGGVAGVYSEVDLGMGCWVNSFPEGCEAGDDSCISARIGWAFGAGPTVFTFLALIVNNLIIYVYVRKNLKPKTAGLSAEEVLSIRSSQERERAEQRKRHIREMASQGQLYVATFFLSYSPAFALRAIEIYGDYPISETSLFPLYVLSSIFLPMQGFFNLFVYNRPAFVRLRAACPDKSLRWTIRKASMGSDIPPSMLQQQGLAITSDSRRSSARNFSTGLQVVREVSQELDFSSVGGDEESIPSIYDPRDDTVGTEDSTFRAPANGDFDFVCEDTPLSLTTNDEKDPAIPHQMMDVDDIAEENESNGGKCDGDKLGGSPSIPNYRLDDHEESGMIDSHMRLEEGDQNLLDLSKTYGPSFRISFDGSVSKNTVDTNNTESANSFLSFWNDEGKCDQTALNQS